jgi:tetratricopeptide (TPR) repeat protein
MDRTLPVFVLLPAVLLLVQGATCLRGERAPFVRWFGVLAVALAGLDVVLALLLLTGTLVPSREFNSVMVKGALPYLGLLVLQVGMSVIAGLGWHVSRMAAGQASRLFRLMVAAVLVGASAVYSVDVLNPLDPVHARVYAYDLLWPPLLLWVGLCFFECCYAIVRLRSRLWRVWADSSLVVAPAVWALESSVSVADEVKFAWWVCLIVFLPLSTGLGAWLANGTWSPDRPAVPLKVRLALSATAAAIGLWIAWPSDVRSVAFWLVWPGFPVLVGMLGLRALWKVQRAEPAQGRPPLRRRQVLAFVALVVIAGTFAELVYFSSVDPLVPLIIFIVAWTVEAEATASGLLTRLGRLALGRQLWTEQSPPRQWAVAGLAKASVVRKSVVDVARALFAMPSVPVAAVKFLVLVLGLIVLTELPNARQTVVEPFTSHVKDEGAAVPLGQRISDRVLNAVALIDQRLRSDTVRLLPRGSETEPAFKLVPAAAGGETAFAKGSELDLGYVKMPATFVLAVTRDPVRAMMRVRVITGSVQLGPKGYEVLAHSSTGETWRIEATEAAGATNQAAADVVSDLAERLAFEIVTATDRSMRMAGLTHSWKAYKHFRIGLDRWQEFETGQHVEDLSAAIGHFREATRNHPSFALAFYRLGLALQRDGQPAAAEEALRTSLRINENLVPAYLALASTLYNHDEYLALVPAPAAASARSLSTENEKKTNRDEAKALWLHVIHRLPHTVSNADRAAAFYGLCNFALDTEKPEEFGTDARDRLRRLAYYYCQRAEHLYAALPAAEQLTAPIKEAEASVLNALGRVLTRNFPSDENLGGYPLIFGGNEDSDPKDVWRCRRYGDLPAGPLREPALRYLEQGEALAPLNEAIKCRVAWLALSLGQTARMRALEVDASARVRLAKRLAIRAKKAKPYERLAAYSLALTEYSEAIKLNPTMFTALNGFANTFWEWRLVSPDEPEAAVFAQDAETYARWALEVAKERRSAEDIIVAGATLGNVLLAQARPLEAIDYLKVAHDAAPGHARWNEVRWSLAQAYLCAGANDIATGVPEREAVRRELAVPLLDKIREIEQTREWRPFSSIPTTLDPAWNYDVCLRNPKAVVDRLPSPEGPLYVGLAQRPSPKQNRLCDRTGVSVEVPGLRRDNDLQVRVWGGGVSRELPVVSGRAPKDLSVQLHSPPRTTRHYYFAQLYFAPLEDPKGRPVSEVYPLRTYSEEGGRCTGNLIRLVFYSTASGEP